jgi:hypothetical protein
MDRHPAAAYWAETCLGHFETMTSRTWPSETDQPTREPRGDRRTRRRTLPPLTASPEIVSAIAACAPKPEPGQSGVQRATALWPAEPLPS